MRISSDIKRGRGREGWKESREKERESEGGRGGGGGGEREMRGDRER